MRLFRPSLALLLYHTASGHEDAGFMRKVPEYASGQWTSTSRSPLSNRASHRTRRWRSAIRFTCKLLYTPISWMDLMTYRAIDAVATSWLNVCLYVLRIWKCFVEVVIDDAHAIAPASKEIVLAAGMALARKYMTTRNKIGDSLHDEEGLGVFRRGEICSSDSERLQHGGWRFDAFFICCYDRVIVRSLEETRMIVSHSSESLDRTISSSYPSMLDHKSTQTIQPPSRLPHLSGSTKLARRFCLPCSDGAAFKAP